MSIGLGGLYLSNLDDALVVSMGTGTALVHAKKNGEMNYLGGTGVGGGTLVGLSKLILQVGSIDHLIEYAEEGNLDNIDLRIKDIVANDSKGRLSGDLTAANFGKVSEVASKGDIALGIMNMVFETVAMVSVFASRHVGVKDVVLTGNLTRLPFCKEKFHEFNTVHKYGVDFLIPQKSQFSTVIGKALAGLKK